ncbi:MAG: TIGR03936 family radical SAM-associated protein [Clostridiales bacterium]|nr:TIGR03936 family radical SAM-associated protein [Clostridiales bacterium]
MRSVRVWLEKSGRAIYTSHLDLNRCMTRAVRRANIPLWYTEGFNPHPYLMFPLPLPLGQSSDGEPMDIRIETDMTDGEIFDALSRVMPEGFTVKSVGEPKDKAGDVAMAQYGITLEFPDSAQAERTAGVIRTLIDGGELTAEKTGKKGRMKVVKEIKLNDFIHRFEAGSEDCYVKISAVLSAGSTVNLNPALLLDALYKAGDFEPVYTEIRRQKLLKSDFSDFE